MKNTLYLLTLAITCQLTSISCQRNNSPTQESSPAGDEEFCFPEDLRQSTTIETVHYQPIQEQLTLTGKIEYNENDFVAFNSLLEGIVQEVNFELGDYVQKGAVLAVVRSHQIQEQYQQKRHLESQLILFKKQLETKKTLLLDGMASNPEILELEHTIESARIELEKINQGLLLYRADTETGNFNIVAPKNGYIVQKKISSGQPISAEGDPLFSLSNLKQVWVMVNIYASNLKYIKQNDPVKVSTIAYPDRYYSGKIDKIYPVFDDDEHVLKARVVLDNPDLHLMPGLSADIHIDKTRSSDYGYAIPNKAIIFSKDKQYVVRYHSDCDLQLFPIVPIASNAQYTFVKEGFSEKDKIVSTNTLLIFEELSK
jgi:cobalt-zinc-cadmium efflux system membrane fusion protein